MSARRNVGNHSLPIGSFYRKWMIALPIQY
jgi:hypothetical protein